MPLVDSIFMMAIYCMNTNDLFDVDEGFLSTLKEKILSVSSRLWDVKWNSEMKKEGQPNQSRQEELQHRLHLKSLNQTYLTHHLFL